MNTKKFCEKATKLYLNHFPKSAVKAYWSGNLYANVSIHCKLAASKNEVAHGIWENDILNVSFCVDLDGKRELPKGSRETLPDKVCLTAWHRSYLTKPENPYHVYGSKKLPFRKITGTPEKILTALDKVFSGLKESLLNDLASDNIHKNHLDLVKEKLS